MYHVGWERERSVFKLDIRMYRVPYKEESGPREPDSTAREEREGASGD